jgi:hypothetical protein
MYPICLIKSYIHLTYELILNFSKNAFWKYFLNLSIRPFRLFYVIYNDIIFLSNNCYNETVPIKEREKENEVVFIKDSIYYLNTLLNYKLRTEKLDSVILEDLIKEIRLSEGKITCLCDQISSNQFNKPRPSIFQDNVPMIKDSNYESMKFTLSLIERLADSNKVIKLIVSLHHLPYYLNYPKLLIPYFKNFNLKQFSKALKKFHFMHTDYHPSLTGKKLNLMVQKLFLKFRLINKLLPETSISNSSIISSSSMSNSS